MKKYMIIILVLLSMATFITAQAEAVDASPAPLLQNAEFFDIAILSTFVGAAAAAEVLVLIIKWLFNLTGNGVRYAVVICSILSVAAGRFLGGDSVTLTNIVLTIFNGAVVAGTLMKVYEITAGYSKTPAGKIE